MFNICVISWYVVAILLLVYLYFKDSKPYGFEREIDVTEKDRSLNDLSLLVYKKIVPEVMTASVVKLIDQAKIKLTEEDDAFWLTKIDDDDLTKADFNLMALLFDIIGDGERVSVNQIYKYCDKKSNNSTFLLNYDLWKKMSVVGSKKGELFEEKREYTFVRFFHYLGILMFILNIVLKVYNLFGFLIIIVAILIKVYFYKISKLTYDSAQEYYGWLEFRGKLRSNSKLFDNNKYLEYSILLKCYDNIPEKLKKEFVIKLDAAIRKCYLNSYFRGNRSLF